MDEAGLCLHPLLNLNLEELWEEVEDEDTAHELKGTGVNPLSRYHSCPQLFEENKVMSLSFEKTADDSADIVSFNRRKFSLHTGRIQTYEPDSPGSSTPTPPSSPRSERNSRSSIQDSPQTPIESQSNFSSPDHCTDMMHDQKHEFQFEEPCLDRVSVSSSDNESESKGHLNVLNPPTGIEEMKHDMLEKERTHYIKRDKKYSKVKFNGTADGKYITSKSENVDKCSKWLQTVKMSTTEKIKSRSHVQLPPS